MWRALRSYGIMSAMSMKPPIYQVFCFHLGKTRYWGVFRPNVRGGLCTYEGGNPPPPDGEGDSEYPANK